MKKFIALSCLLLTGFCIANLFAAAGSGPSSTQVVLPGFEKQDYLIKPNDRLSVNVIGVPELTLSVNVTSTGMISFPYIDEQVRVAGYTETEVNKILADYLSKDYLVNPQVLVLIEEYHQEVIFVAGAVVKPGPYPLPANRRVDIREAILWAEGFTPVANQNKIEFTRVGSPTKQTFKWNDLIKNSDPSKKIWLQPNDQIEVLESFF